VTTGTASDPSTASCRWCPYRWHPIALQAAHRHGAQLPPQTASTRAGVAVLAVHLAHGPRGSLRYVPPVVRQSNEPASGRQDALSFARLLRAF